MIPPLEPSLILTLMVLGFFVGVVGGFFGVGGTWIVTPALNLLGLPISVAVGTDLLHTMGKSLVATIRHHRFGHVDFKLGGVMLLSTAVGIEVGKDALLELERQGVAEALVRAIYVLLLFSISLGILWEYFRAHKGSETEAPRLKLYEKVRRIPLPPRIGFTTSKIDSIFLGVPLFVGFLTGVLAGFLGVGAGFVRMPALVYFLGVPTKVAVGTDLFEIVFSAGIGAFLYAAEGRVHVLSAALMLVGASLGAQLGSLATRFVRSSRIRLYFAFATLVPAVGLLLSLLGPPIGRPELGKLGLPLLLGSAVVLTLLIFREAIRGLRETEGKGGLP